MLLKCCTQYTSTFWPQDWKRSIFIPISKNVKNITQLHSFHMLARKCSKFFKLGLNSTWTKKVPDVQAWFKKGRGTSDQIANIHWIIEKASGFQENIYFCFIDYGEAFDCVDHNKLWKILKKMGITDHLTCLLRNLSAGQEVTVRTGQGTKDWFRIGKGLYQGCILSTCLFNLYA